MSQVAKWFLITFAAAALSMFCVCTGSFPMDVPFFAITGWAFYLARVIPQTHVRWDLAAHAVLYATILILLAHSFLRWLYGNMGTSADAAATPRSNWKLKWTMSGFAIVVLMFCSGIASIGIVHQINWAARSPQRMFEPGTERANHVRCAANLRLLMPAILLYANNHQKAYPDDLATLIVDADLNPEGLICPSSDDERAPGTTSQEQMENARKPGHCSYYYFGKGLTELVDSERVIALELPSNHQKGIHVLYGDGHVNWLELKEAEPLLVQLGFEKVQPAPASSK